MISLHQQPAEEPKKGVGLVVKNGTQCVHHLWDYA